MARKATPSARARAREPAWCKRFLDGLAKTGTVRGGAAAARIHRATAYKRRGTDEQFAAAWADVEEGVVERLEETALSLALAGDVKLIEFLLKARRPNTYREQHRIELGGLDGAPISAEITSVDAKEAADASHDFLARIAGPAA